MPLKYNKQVFEACFWPNRILWFRLARCGFLVSFAGKLWYHPEQVGRTRSITALLLVLFPGHRSRRAREAFSDWWGQREVAVEVLAMVLAPLKEALPVRD